MDNPRNAPEPPTVDLDLAQTPPIIRRLARWAESLPPEEIRREACNTRPHVYGHPVHGLGSGWFPELDRKARDFVKAYAVGVALGVTALEAEPVTELVKAAATLDRGIRDAQAKDRKAKAIRSKELEAATERRRAAAKAARKARRAQA